MSSALPAPKNDLPDYSVAGESTLGALVIGEEPLRIIVSDPRVAEIGRRTTMSLQETVMPPTAAISISESPDMPVLGLSDGQIRRLKK